MWERKSRGDDSGARRGGARPPEAPPRIKRRAEIALLRVIAESRAGVELALDALARAAATIAESGYSPAAQDRFAELLQAALLREA